MKLPEFQTAPVQSVGGIEENQYALTQLGHAQAAAWRAGGKLTQEVGDWGFEIARGVTQVQHAEAVADVASADAKAKREMSARVLMSKDELAAKYGGEENIPQSIKDRVGGLDKLVEDPNNPDTSEGQVVGRTDIPAWAVNPDLYQKDMKAAVEAAAQKISLPGYRNKFLAEANKSIDVETEGHRATAQKEFYAWKNASMGLLADRAIGDGHPELAKSIIRMMDVPEDTRVKLLNRADVMEAEFELNEPLLKQDMVGMGNILEGLKSGQTKFAYVDGSGEVKHVDVSALPEQTRRGLALQMGRQLKAFSGSMEQEAKQQQAQLDDGYRSQFVDMAVAGNWAGMRNVLAHPPANMSGKIKKELLQFTEAQLDRLKKPSPEQNTTKNLYTSTLLDAFDEAARGDDPSTPNPEDPARVVDPRTVDLGELYRRGFLSEPDYKKFSKAKSDLLSGKTIIPRNVDVKDGESYVTTKLGVTKGDAADVKAAFRTDLIQEEKRRGKKMDRNEILEYAQSWAAEGRKDTGMLWWKSAEASPALADVPLNYLHPIQVALANYPDDQYPRTAAGMGNLYRERIQPLEGVVQSAWADTKEVDTEKYLKPPKLIGYAAAIDLQRKSLHDDLVNFYNIKNPSDEQLAQYYFQKMGLLKKVVFGRRLAQQP